MYQPPAYGYNGGGGVQMPRPPTYNNHLASQASLHSTAGFSSYAPSHTSSFASLPPHMQQHQQPQFTHQPSYASLPQGVPPSLPPFQFLRLKSFSTHTNGVLRKLEAAILQSPGNAQAYLDLGEEYRILGARHSYLRVLEYGKENFPNEPTFRTLLYQHLPQRPRTPPPKEPEIQMERTTTYDYKWRHREQNMFPKQILRLDTNVPPYGRQLRTQYMHFLTLVKAEDLYLSKARKKQLHAEALKAMESTSSNNDNTEDDVVLILPAGFNKTKNGPQAIVPPKGTRIETQTDKPVATTTTTIHQPIITAPLMPPVSPLQQAGRTSSAHSSSGSGSQSPPADDMSKRSSGRGKFLAPSEEQKRRDSGTKPINVGVRRKSSSSSRSSIDESLLTPEQRAALEREREEELERRWKLEEEREAELERKQREEMEWREKQEELEREKLIKKLEAEQTDL